MNTLKISVDGVLRDMTKAEITQYELDQIAEAKLKEADAVKVVAKSALFDRLGITADEAALLLG